jgi:hypothetical protein
MASRRPSPAHSQLDQYAVARVQEDVKETDRDRIKSSIEGMLVSSYLRPGH